VREDAVGEFVGHGIGGLRVVIEGRDQREDGCACVCGQGHVADVDFVEWGLADAEHQRAVLFESDIGGAFDEARGGAVGDASEGAYAAWDDDHGVGRIRPAGHVRADVGIGLLLNLCRRRADDLTEKVGAAFDSEFLGHDAQGAVGSDEIDGFHARVTLDGE